MVNRQKKAMSWIETVKGGAKSLLGKDLSRAVSQRAVSAVTPAASPASYAKGGVVKRTGLAKVHKNELVLTAKQRGALKKLLK
jgi:hypothetical protein